MDLFESFATATFNWNPLDDKPMHPVTFYNLKTQAPVKVDVLPDTGASITVLDSKYAKLLGVDEAAAPKAKMEGIGDKVKSGFYAILPMRIANLAVVAVQILFISGLPVNVLGRTTGFTQYRTTFTWNKIYYEELAKKAATAAAYARSYAAFRGRR